MREEGNGSRKGQKTEKYIFQRVVVFVVVARGVCLRLETGRHQSQVHDMTMEEK